MTTTDLPSSGSSVGRRASTAIGWLSTPTKLPAERLSKPVFHLGARCCSPMRRPTTRVYTPSMARSATPCMSGRAMTTATASARSIVILVKGWGRPCAPICALSAVFINTTWLSTWQPLRPCSMPRSFRPRLSSGCASVRVRESAPHEPKRNEIHQ